MLCELEVNNIGTYVELITRIDAEQQYRMWFRGQSDYSWGLVPSVQRKDGMGEHYEQYITTNFMIHTMRLNPSVPQRYDRASWLTLMQHYGLPTRLLDWSESPLVALYFALSSDEDAKTDAAVWVLNPMELNKKWVMENMGGRELLALLDNIQAGNVTFLTTVNNASEEAETEEAIEKDA